MGNMLRAEVEIIGLRPLLWHHFGPDALPLTKVEKEGVAGNDPTEWRRTVLATKGGRLFLDPAYVFGAIRDGARYTRRGRGSIQAAVSATLQIAGEQVMTDQFMPDGALTEDREDSVYLDVRGVRNPSTKARNVRYRVAARSGWRVQFAILWDKTVVSRGEMEAVLNDAGKLSGIGSGRSIGFGRFIVVRFEVSEG